MRRFLALLSVLTSGLAQPALAGTGYSYRLHEAKLDEESFDEVPLDCGGATVSHVEQGPVVLAALAKSCRKAFPGLVTE